MREIKFRILDTYNPRKKEWIYFTLEDLIIDDKCGDTGYWDIDTNSQYTGLKDNNGKEIFENDIVEINQLDGSLMQFIIVFKDFCWYLKVNGSDSYLQLKLFTVPELLPKIKIIGNSFEHPELLKGGE